MCRMRQDTSKAGPYFVLEGERLFRVLRPYGTLSYELCFALVTSLGYRVEAAVDDASMYPFKNGGNTM
jgi:hypothetical protein